MGVAASISRFTDYYKRHGLRATCRRTRLAVHRALFAKRMVVFYCDLNALAPASVNLPSPLKIERLQTCSALSESDLEAMTSFWNPKLAQRNIRERFAKGASLWQIRSADQLAGYGWSLRGATIEPYYLVLAPNDVHLFDFHVFPQYRGQGLNPRLVNHILNVLGREREGRAFIDAAEWNAPQLASLRKTAFSRLGLAKSLKIFGRTFVSWSERETSIQLGGIPQQNDRPLTVAKDHER